MWGSYGSKTSQGADALRGGCLDHCLCAKGEKDVPLLAFGSKKNLNLSCQTGGVSSIPLGFRDVTYRYAEIYSLCIGVNLMTFSKKSKRF